MAAIQDVVYRALTPQLVTADAGSTDVFDVSGCRTIFAQLTADVPPSDQTFNSGRSEVTTVTFPTKAASTGGDYFVIYDSAGLAWAAALNKSGSDPAPSGAIYTAIAAGRKVNVDISSATTEAQVEALVETAFDALVGNPFTTTAATADMVVTCTIRANTTNASVHNADDSGAGSIVVVTTTAGINSDVDITANTIAISNHGYLTGQALSLTSTGTLPAPLATSTEYFVIKVSDNSIKLASSLEDAEDGTPIDITNQGSSAAVNTADVEQIAGGSVKFQKSAGGGPDGLPESEWVWFDEGNAVNITADGSIAFEKVDPCGKYYRFLYAISDGQMNITGYFVGKGPRP